VAGYTIVLASLLVFSGALADRIGRRVGRGPMGLAPHRVPEPKTVKNRVHSDVTVPSAAQVALLVEAGAALLREPGGGIGWHVLADPEGNEFCVFTDD
jgi:hypothetical protein